MDRWDAWLRQRPYHHEQVVNHRSIPGRDPAYREVSLTEPLGDVLASEGIERLYRHQAEAIDAIRSGRNLMLTTPTASGKSLAYAVPAVERAIEETHRTLYIGPQNALIADQTSVMARIEEALGFGSRFVAREYTGRLDRSEKAEVRDRRPTFLLTNPDMLHYGILPHGRRLWEWFLSDLSLIVIDECHAYRGVFGSHVALILRRLDRLCATFGADPQVVCCSATIGNPREHAARLTGRSDASFAVIEEDTSATGPQEWAFWNPPEHDGDGHGRRRSSHVEAMNVFVDLVSAGHQTVVFTRSRQVAERYAMASQRRLRELDHPELANAVHAYEGALEDARRTDIERGLSAGSIRGVWSTNALELGVDIGGLDAVILDGYPGTRTGTHQRAGRAGRGDDRSLVVLIAGEDQLDQYVMENPETLFEVAPERAVVNPENQELFADHVRAAARESWLRPEDTEYFGATFPTYVANMTAEGLLDRRETQSGIRWVDAGEATPHHDMSIRTIDDTQISLVRHDSGKRLATLDRNDAMRDAHPGAIYHHQGQAYEVVDLDLDRRRAELSPTWANEYTEVYHDKDVSIRSRSHDHELPTCPEATVAYGELTVRVQITGYARKDAQSGRVLAEEPLELPERSLATEGLWVTIPPRMQARLTEDGEFLGGIHAAEHGMISLFPLEVLCDRGDIGGLSTPHHPDTGHGTIFVYDGHPGGVGLTREGFERFDALLERTAALIGNCSCADGCPACVQSPQCGNGNEPLDPDTALALLDGLLGAAAQTEG